MTINKAWASPALIRANYKSNKDYAGIISCQIELARLAGRNPDCYIDELAEVHEKMRREAEMYKELTGKDIEG